MFRSRTPMPGSCSKKSSRRWGKDHNLVDHAAGRAIGGMSDGGLSSFTAAWERPDAFSKVVQSHRQLHAASRRVRSIRISFGKPAETRNPYGCSSRME